MLQTGPKSPKMTFLTTGKPMSRAYFAQFGLRAGLQVPPKPSRATNGQLSHDLEDVRKSDKSRILDDLFERSKMAQ